MMQISIALLGHLRGGPAKVAVVSSALNGVVSGSSVSNVVSGGIFTIPLMKRSGLSGVKAGAIEASSSINGQIMPPVMGAAAFLMVEYVGIPYSEIVKHAALPAILSYIALFYIVHLEAVKIDSKLIPRESFPMRDALDPDRSRHFRNHRRSLRPLVRHRGRARGLRRRRAVGARGRRACDLCLDHLVRRALPGSRAR